MLDRYGGLIWLVVFVAAYGGICVLAARDARRSRGWCEGPDGGTSLWEVNDGD